MRVVGRTTGPGCTCAAKLSGGITNARSVAPISGGGGAQGDHGELHRLRRGAHAVGVVRRVEGNHALLLEPSARAVLELELDVGVMPARVNGLRGPGEGRLFEPRDFGVAECETDASRLRCVCVRGHGYRQVFQWIGRTSRSALSLHDLEDYGAHFHVGSGDTVIRRCMIRGKQNEQLV